MSINHTDNVFDFAGKKILFKGTLVKYLKYMYLKYV